MRTRFNKAIKIFLLSLVVLAVGTAFKLSESPVAARSLTAPPASRTGAPAFGATVPAELICTACHRDSNNVANSLLNLNNPTTGGKIELVDLPNSYVPGQEYTVKVAVSQIDPNATKFGFELVALDSTGNSTGTLANIDATRTQVSPAPVAYSGTTRTYIYHFPSAAPQTGTVATGLNRAEWTFKWTAPATRVGKIGFYAAGNVTNGGGSNAGDQIYTTSAALTPDVVTQNAASGTTVDVTAGGIGSAYGMELATQTATGSDTDAVTPGIQLPIILGGTTVRVRDMNMNDRAARLFFVSPGQVNYQIPSNTAAGNADVTITNSDGIVSTGKIKVSAVSPGIFSVTSDGNGLAAAQVQRIAGTASSFEPTAQFVGTTWTAVPIDWVNQTDSLYLVLYGTGLRNTMALGNVGVKIGSTTLPVQYAGPHGTFVGVDQINLLLPRTLAGSGLVDLILTAEGKPANTVKVNFK
jgi:uncharacterized protein (TIGR03437 family)